MKQIIILLAMLATLAGAWHSLQKRGSFVEAALLSEGLTLSAPVKARVSAFYGRRGTLPSDNIDVGLPKPKSLYGSSVTRIAVNEGGVVRVDFSERIGERSMSHTPYVDKANGSLNWACTSDSIEETVLEKLMPPCEFKPPSDVSRLMQAIANSEAQKVTLLLAAIGDPNIVFNRDTPLMLAAKVGDIAIMRQLLDAGALVDIPANEKDVRTALMVAIVNDQVDATSLLLNSEASVTLQDSQGMSAMDHAVLTDRRLGVERYVRMVSTRFNPRLAGANEVAIQKVVDEQAEEKRLQALYLHYLHAIQSCHVQRLSSLLGREGELASYEMVQGVSMVEHIRLPKCAPILLQHLRTKPSYRRAAIAYVAARTQQCDDQAVARVLEENPALDVTRQHQGRSMIDRAVTSGCDSLLLLMVREKQLAGKLSDDIIVKAISLAPQDTMIKLISNLIEAGANVNGQDDQGQTPLTTAIAHEQPVIAKYLVDAGASVTARTYKGSYPVIEATKKGYEHLVLQLVEQGADLNAQDRFGRTALLAAVNRGQQRLVRSLLKAGADTHITDSNGINAIVLADSRSLKTIKSVLVASAD